MPEPTGDSAGISLPAGPIDFNKLHDALKSGASNESALAKASLEAAAGTGAPADVDEPPVTKTGKSQES